MEEKLLGAKELIRCFKPTTNAIPGKGGLKDYEPDGSWMQNRRITQFYNERYDMLREGKVAKIGLLASGVWDSTLMKVEIKKGYKFLQYMGHSESGKLYLEPEEALYLIDEGSLQIIHHNLPVSLQQGYAMMLGNNVTIEQYHVYSHLVRLGYTVRRHLDVSDVTQYEHKIGLHKANKLKAKNKKRRNRKKSMSDSEDDLDNLPPDVKKKKFKRGPADSVLSLSPHTTTKSIQEAQNECGGDILDIAENLEGDVSCNISHPEVSTSSNQCVKRDENMETELMEEDQINGSHDEVSDLVSMCSFVWDFDQLVIPDISHVTDEKSSKVLELGFPDATFVPFTPDSDCGTTPIDVSKFWKPKKKCTEDLEFSFNGVTKAKSKAKNWTEYKAECSDSNSWKSWKNYLGATPADVLWQDEGEQPLVSPLNAGSKGDVMKCLQIVQPADLFQESPSSEKSTEPALKIMYDVYAPNTDFKKSRPGTPNHRVCVMRQSDATPSLSTIVDLTKRCTDGAPLYWAVVDNGSISFYCFHGSRIPILVDNVSIST